MPTKPRKVTPSLIFRLDANHRVYIALALCAVAGAFTYSLNRFTIPGVVLTTWVTFALCVIILDWVCILTCHPKEVRLIAKLGDSSRFMIFFFVVTAALVSIVAIYLLLKSAAGKVSVDRSVLLSMASVIISWWLVHTVFTMRYAHLYYGNKLTKDGKDDGGGLDFPGDDKEPDYMDFVYFSFVLGMTFQVSDVVITSKRIRRLAWGHGLISFAFNTAIVALGINIISGLIAK